MIKKLAKQEFYKAINGLLEDFEVIGPAELPGKGIFYQAITNIKDLYLGERLAFESIKRFFLPPSESLFKEDLCRTDKLEAAPLAQQQRLIIGLRPCEARALTLLDRVFVAAYKDDSYMARRNNSILIGLSCLNPDKDCFCTSLGGSPVDSRGLDALALPLGTGEEFIIDAFTDKAKAIFEAWGKSLTKQDEQAWELAKEKLSKGLPKKIKIPEKLDTIFESNYWRDVSRSCLNCGVCTNLCPSCHCFDLLDEQRQRLRCYDGCAFSDFTLEASGVNPRPTKKERYRQRVFHKFDYFKKNFGENLCVGCGRCIRHCPVKMDISQIVANAPVQDC